METLILLVMSEINPRYITTLTYHLEKTFNRRIEVRYDIRSLKYAFDKARKQYKSPSLLSRLRRMKRSAGEKIIAVVDVDLYSPGYEFVYGEADMNAGVATLSINRLVAQEGDAVTDFSLFEERIIREAIHEVGHLFGLGHCRELKCVMRTCTCLPEVDEAAGGLCEACQEKLTQNIQGA